MTFKDHFSRQADNYSAARPTYPETLFAALAARAPARQLAWDAACGSGQASIGLAAHFDRVIATDASANQIEGARAHARIEYSRGAAEESELPTASVDLVCIAQALHWLDVQRFYDEALRVLKPGGILTAVSYPLLKISPQIDALIQKFYVDTVGQWWPPERRHVENGYADLAFPEPRLTLPDFGMRIEYRLQDLLIYLRSWSAVERAHASLGRDPVDDLQGPLTAAWGDTALRCIRWPLVVLAHQKA